MYIYSSKMKNRKKIGFNPRTKRLNPIIIFYYYIKYQVCFYYTNSLNSTSKALISSLNACLSV